MKLLLQTLQEAMDYYFLNNFKKRQIQHHVFERFRCGYRKFIPIRFTKEKEDCKEPRLALKRVNDFDRLEYTIEGRESTVPQSQIVNVLDDQEIALTTRHLPRTGERVTYTKDDRPDATQYIGTIQSIDKVGLYHELEELCTQKKANANGQTTMMKVDPTLYFIELVFKEGRQHNLGGKCDTYKGATPDWFCNPREKEIDHAFKNGWSMLPFKFFDDKKDEKYNDFKICPYCRFNLRVWARMDKRIPPGNQNGAMKSDKSERAYFEKVLEENKKCEQKHGT